MTQAHEYRRHSDGSIDFDFYRARAIAMRSQAIQDAFKSKVTFNYERMTYALLMLTLIIGATIAAFAPAHWV